MYRTDKHLWITVDDAVVETTGSKLHLNCILEGQKELSSNKVVWGRKNKEIRFENVADLVKLAENGSKELLDLDNQHSMVTINRATNNFDSISIADMGTYFCMNLKHKLFKIIRIEVYEQLVPCGPEQVNCANGKQCIERDELCDGIYQCFDHSDETKQRCNKWQCLGRISCGDHCIPTKWCCDIKTDRDCFITVRNPCCPPLPPENDVFIDDKDHVYDEIPISPKSKTGYNLVLGIVAAVVVLIACLVIFYIVQKCHARNSDNSNNHNEMPLPAIIHTDDNNPTILNTLMGMINSEYYDLPPSYADSTRNTPINSPPSSTRSSLEDITTVDVVDHDSSLPPTYDEAIANLNSSNSSLANQPDTNRSVS